MNPESLGPVVGIIFVVLAITYGILAFLIPIFIYCIHANSKKLLDEQIRANKMFEACLKRILEESIKANRNLATLINGLTQS